MKKRICAICLVLALLAANQVSLAGELTIFGEVAVPEEIDLLLAAEPVISVHLPTNSWVAANPYGMEIERDGVVSSEEIVSPTLILENQSEVPVQVDARAVGAVQAGSEMVFVQTPSGQDATAKEIFLYAEFQPLMDARAEAVWSGSFRDASNQLLITDVERSKEDVMTLEAAGSSYSLGAMQVFGALSTHPDQPWGAADKFTLNFVFSFAAADEYIFTAAGGPDADSELASEGYSEPFFEDDPSLEDDASIDESFLVPPSPQETLPDEEVPDEEVPDGTLSDTDSMDEEDSQEQEAFDSSDTGDPVVTSD